MKMNYDEARLGRWQSLPSYHIIPDQRDTSEE